jgi:hypothetical protein
MRGFTVARPQYVFVCVAPNRRWSQNRPESITDTLFLEVIEETGVRGDPTGARRLGLSFIFSYLHGPPDKMDETLRRLLAQSEKHDVPVLIVLEGRDWWGYRPDLWNWWDPTKPGYDPKNRENVEWTGWGPENAVKISWRNWGSQIRVLPAPNIHGFARPIAANWIVWRAFFEPGQTGCRRKKSTCVPVSKSGRKFP